MINDLYKLLAKIIMSHIRFFPEQVNVEPHKMLKGLLTLQPNVNDFEKKINRYIKYSNEIKNIKILDELGFVIGRMAKEQLYPNVIVLSQLINKLCEFNCFSEARDLYRDATLKNIADAATHTSMIKQSNKHSRLIIAKEAFQNAINPKNPAADVATYSSIIDVARKHGKKDKTLIELAELAHDLAINTNEVNNVFYETYIDALVCNDRIQDAMKVIKKIGIKAAISNVGDIYEIDLHGLTYGSAYLALNGFLDEHQNEVIEVIIIHGRRSHSRDKTIDNDEHTLREAVLRFMYEEHQNHIIDHDAVSEDAINNYGRCKCIIKPRLQLQQMNQQNIHSTPFFPEVIQQKEKEDNDAKENKSNNFAL